MKKSKSSVSKAASYEAMGDYWDRHDVSGILAKRKPVKFNIEIKSETTYFSLDQMLADEVGQIAEQRGVTASTLINLWIQQKLYEQNTAAPSTSQRSVFFPISLTAVPSKARKTKA